MRRLKIKKREKVKEEEWEEEEEEEEEVMWSISTRSAAGIFAFASSERWGTIGGGIPHGGVFVFGRLFGKRARVFTSRATSATRAPTSSIGATWTQLAWTFFPRTRKPAVPYAEYFPFPRQETNSFFWFLQFKKSAFFLKYFYGNRNFLFWLLLFF